MSKKKAELERGDTEDLSKAADDDEKSPSRSDKKKGKKKAKKVALGRQNTRQQAIDDGQEFLEATNFDPNQKRSRQAPARLGGNARDSESDDDSDEDVDEEEEEDSGNDKDDTDYGKPKKAGAKKPATKRKRGSTGSTRKARKTGTTSSPAASTRVTRSKAAATSPAPATPSPSKPAPSPVPSPSSAPKPAPAPPRPTPAATAATAAPTASSSAIAAPIDWRFSTGVPTFAVSVTHGGVWIGDQNGQVTLLDISGQLSAKIKLPAGVKCIVNDFSWLYCGCDNGVVYDLTNKKEPRVMYDIHNRHSTQEKSASSSSSSSATSASSDTKNESMDVDKKEEKHADNDAGVTEEVVKLSSSGKLPPPILRSSSFVIPPSASSTPTLKKKHVVFAIDVSTSMITANRLAIAKRNVQMILNDHVQDDDFVSLVSFGFHVFEDFKKLQRKTDKDKILQKVSALSANGSTAFYDAVQKCMEILSADGPEITKYIIALTDGDDNASKKNAATIGQELQKVGDVNFICVGVGTVAQAETIRRLCENTPDGLYIPVSDSSGIDSAFKLIAQILGAKICWMDINDGRLAVSDAKGNVSLLNSEGHCMWTKKSSGRGGWMVTADPVGVYHGHSLGVTKYNLRSGDQEWDSPTHPTATFATNEPVLFGAQTFTHVYAGAGKHVGTISKKDGSRGATFVTDVAVSSTVPSKDGKTIYAADVDANIYAFDLATGSRKFKFQTGCGTALSMACSAQDHLYIVTTKGILACVDVSEDSVKAAVEGRPRKIREVQDVKEMEVVQPDSEVEKVTSVDPNHVLLECVHDISDDEVLKIHNALHDRSVSSVEIQGVSHDITTNESDCRFVIIHQLTFIEQSKTKTSKYATMAQNGHKISWVVNGGRWGLVVDGKVERNGSACVVKVSSDTQQSVAGAAFKKDLTVQFPKNLREVGKKFVVDNLVLAEDGTFYRTQGTIKALH